MNLFLHRRNLLISILSLPALGIFGESAFGQSFGKKPIKWLVPYAAGGGQDFIARTIAQQLSTDIGQTVVVENKPGGNGAIAVAELLRASADDYVFMTVDNGHLVFNPILYKNLGFDPGKEMALVSTTGKIPLILVANPDFEAKTAKDFIALAKKSPGKYNYASAGPGTPHHIAMELLKHRTGIHLVHIPYRGGAPAMTDVAGGQIPVMMADLAFAAGFIKAGKIRPLAVADAVRLPQLPDVPTFAEVGVEGMETFVFSGVVTSPKVPAEVLEAMNSAVVAALKNKNTVQKLSAASVQPYPVTIAEFKSMVEHENEFWKKIIQEQKITVD